MLQLWPWPSSLWGLGGSGSGSGPVGHVASLQKALCPLASNRPNEALRWPLGQRWTRERKVQYKTQRGDWLSAGQVWQLYCNWKIAKWKKVLYLCPTSWKPAALWKPGKWNINALLFNKGDFSFNQQTFTKLYWNKNCLAGIFSQIVSIHLGEIRPNSL